MLGLCLDKKTESSNIPKVFNDLLKNRKDLIGLWADKFVELEVAFPRSKVFEGRDFKFLKLIGDSVYRINVYNSSLIKKLKKSLTEDNFKDIKRRDIQRLQSYLFFNNNLIASKIKHFFFREIPKDNRNEPFFQIDRDIFEIGQKLWSMITSKKFKDYQYHVFRYFYLLKLLYAFVYDSYRDEGVFLHFEYNKESYNQLRTKLETDLEKVKIEEQLRDFIHSIMPNICGQHLHNANLLDEVPESLSVRSIFSYFVQAHNFDVDIKVEPLTWNLADQLIKIDGLIQDSLEFVFDQDRKEFEEKLIIEVKKFIHSYFQIGDNIYTKEKMYDEDLYELESKFLYEFVDPNMRVAINKDRSTNIFKKLDNMFAEVPVDFEERKIDLNKDELDKIKNKLKNLRERDLKVESLLEQLDIPEIESLLQLYAGLGNKKESHIDCLVGFYSSGVFLAHIYNLYHKQDLPVWMFKAFPYLDIHPLHQDDCPSRGYKALIFDESVKTRFTYSLFEAFIDRSFFHNFDSYEIYALFDHQDYFSIETYKRPWVYSLFQVSKGVFQYTNHYSSKIHFSASIDQFDLKLKKEEIKNILTVKIGDNKRYDLTYLMANTKASFIIANYLAEKVISSNQEKKEVFLFSPSAVGRVLSLLVGYLLKRRYVNIFYDPNKCNGCYKVLIDMSRVTGFTAKHEWKSITDRPLNEKIDFNEFDLSLIVDHELS